MEPLYAADAFLVDRVFQRITDRLARFASCYAIAAFLLTGAILCKLAGAVWDEGLLRWLDLMVVLPITFILVLAHIRDLAPLSDVLPMERISLAWLRVPGLFLTPLAMIAFAATWKLTSALHMSHWLLLTPGAYFMSCRKTPPPARQRSRAEMASPGPLNAP